MSRGRYYLARVVKTGRLTQASLRAAIMDAPIVPVVDALWTITDVIDRSADDQPFIFGRLSKYAPEGALTLVDPVTHAQLGATAENLLIAASPFVYLPDFSGIAYLHVWNGVPENTFRRRFSHIIEEAHERFFATCEIDPVSDYEEFSAKLKELTEISEIRAKVRPPNPLFGDLWRDLNKYIKDRNASEVTLAEKSGNGKGLQTRIVELVNEVLSKEHERQKEPAAITDAALLMAADGYGYGKVVGHKMREKVIIRTSDAQKSFLYEKEPNVAELAVTARQKFEAVSSERNMEHG